MTDTKLLKARMVLKDVTTKDLADALGVGTSTMYRKINDETPFFVPEVVEITRILDLDPPTRNAIFFADDIS